MEITDDKSDLAAATICVGEDARPTGRLRMLKTQNSDRFQSEWRGCLGVVWVDVPMIGIDHLPPQIA